MIVALDGTPLTVSTGGVRRYTEELARALATQFPDDRYHWISDQRFHSPRDLPANLIAEVRKPHNFIDRRWWLIGVQRDMNRIGAELFHGTEFSVPYLPLRPAVLTLHDLSPWMNREWHFGADRVRKRTPLLIGLGLATMIITPTEAVRAQAMEFFRIHPDRVMAIPEAAGTHFRPVPPENDHEAYFLYVGTLEPRKNLLTVIDAWREVRRRHDVELVLAGRRREDFPKLPDEPGLRVLGETLERELPALYSGAVASLYPSLYEGFGLPVLEAMQCGTAVITTRDPAISEVSGGAAIHIDATDTKSWMAAMELMLIKPDELANRRERSLRQAREFSWARTAQRTREVYVEAFRRFGS
jgi:glycosyltransferase involved in cell wall biosynthesis